MEMKKLKIEWLILAETIITNFSHFHFEMEIFSIQQFVENGKIFIWHTIC